MEKDRHRSACCSGRSIEYAELGGAQLRAAGLVAPPDTAWEPAGRDAILPTTGLVLGPPFVPWGVIHIQRKCSRCGAHTSIDGVLYCWKCREKIPIRTPGPVRREAVTRGIGQAVVLLSLCGVVAATFWWALQ